MVENLLKQRVSRKPGGSAFDEKIVQVAEIWQILKFALGLPRGGDGNTWN